MLNTNGIRIAQDAAFAEAAWPSTRQGFEVYLQFDSLQPRRVDGPARRRPARACASRRSSG